MQSPLQTRDLINFIASTILRLADSRDDPERLADLQALAGVNRKTREVLGGHKDLLAARATFAECAVQPHEHTAFEQTSHASMCGLQAELEEPCECRYDYPEEDCECPCHAPCTHCADEVIAKVQPKKKYSDHSHTRTQTTERDNDEVQDGQCADFQRFRYALYKLGNLRAAMYYLDAAHVYEPFSVLVNVPLLVQRLQLDAATEVVFDRKLVNTPIVFPRYGPIATAIFYPLNRFYDALVFVKAVGVPEKSVKELGERLLLPSCMEHVTAEKLALIETMHLGCRSIYPDIVAIRSATDWIIKWVYDTITSDPERRLVANVPGLIKWLNEHAPEPLKHASETVFWMLGGFVGRAIESPERIYRMRALHCLLFMLKCIEPLVPVIREANFWDYCLASAQFRAVNKAVLRPRDCGASQFEQLETAKKRLKTECCRDTARVQILDAQTQVLADQRVLLDYMEFVAKHFPKETTQ